MLLHYYYLPIAGFVLPLLIELYSLLSERKRKLIKTAYWLVGVSLIIGHFFINIFMVELFSHFTYICNENQ
jgi:hypothetical protein